MFSKCLVCIVILFSYRANNLKYFSSFCFLLRGFFVSSFKRSLVLPKDEADTMFLLIYHFISYLDLFELFVSK